MRYFFDTEFIERPWGLSLISIGVVAEDGREFYAHTWTPQESWMEPDRNLSDWVRQNVLTKLQPSRYPNVKPQSPENIRVDLLSFIGDDSAPEFWAYYGAYDWVALCFLMGGMLNLPKGWPWICRELRTALDEAGLADFRDDGREDEHNALADARWVRSAFLRIAPTPAAIRALAEKATP